MRAHGGGDVLDCCDMDTKEGGLVLPGGGSRLPSLWRPLFELQAPLKEAETSNCYGGRRRNRIKYTRRFKGESIVGRCGVRVATACPEVVDGDPCAGARQTPGSGNSIIRLGQKCGHFIRCNSIML